MAAESVNPFCLRNCQPPEAPWNRGFLSRWAGRGALSPPGIRRFSETRRLRAPHHRHHRHSSPPFAATRQLGSHRDRGKLGAAKNAFACAPHGREDRANDSYRVRSRRSWPADASPCVASRTKSLHYCGNARLPESQGSSEGIQKRRTAKAQGGSSGPAICSAPPSEDLSTLAPPSHSARQVTWQTTRS
jgi:hypothetical protein